MYDLSMINDDLVENKEFYKKLLDKVSNETEVYFNKSGDIEKVNNFQTNCTFTMASLYTVKYNIPIDTLIEYLEDIEWEIYLKY